MKIFGLTLFEGRKSADDIAHFSDGAGGWWPIIREGFAGAWQQNITIRRHTLLAFTAVYACINRISKDIGKMPACLKKKVGDVWVDIARNSPYLAVLQKPNDFQIWSQLIQQWLISKLIAGNAYILKVRDNRGIVIKLYVLDPTRCRPLVTPDGSVYYELGYDPLSEQLEPTLICPASEIIHDRMPALFHPLVGTSPIFACGLAAAQGHAMQKSQAAFFRNMAQPSGILTAPGPISDETAKRLKDEWTSKYSGNNVGKVAVLGDNLKFQALTVSASDAKVIEQLKWTSETVCSAFDVPPFMVGFAPPPTYTNIEAITQSYWSQCLQAHISDIECLLDDGLGLVKAGTPEDICVKLDLDVLLKMDTPTRYRTWKDGISGGFLKPNEVRKKENMEPVAGGDSCYMQQQNYSLEALAKRDSAPASVAPGSKAPALPNPDKPEDDTEPKEDDYATDYTGDSIPNKSKGFDIEPEELMLLIHSSGRRLRCEKGMPLG